VITVEYPALGQELRALRTAARRTVSSVAADAGLSMPYVANLENGRGNPTAAALGRLATALGMRLDITLVPATEPAVPDVPSGLPASLARFGRGRRFRRAADVMAGALAADSQRFSAQLIGALATLANTLGTDLSDTDWGRLLDALVLVVTQPAAAGPPPSPGRGGALISR
jgi:transcriptional regulator with XRE-family HTH domain